MQAVNAVRHVAEQQDRERRAVVLEKAQEAAEEPIPLERAEDLGEEDAAGVFAAGCNASVHVGRCVGAARLELVPDQQLVLRDVL